MFNSDRLLHGNLRYVLSINCSVQKRTDLPLEWCGAAIVMTLNYALRNSLVPRGTKTRSSAWGKAWAQAAAEERHQAAIPRALRPGHGSGNCWERSDKHFIAFLPSQYFKGKEKAGTSFSWAMALLKEKDLAWKEHSSLSTRLEPWPLFLSSKVKAHRPSSWSRKREKKEMKKTSL